MANADQDEFRWFHETLYLPKIGESPESSADRAAVSDKDREISVADGVSRSYKPGTWAEKVVVDSLFVGGIPSEERIMELSSNLDSSDDSDDWIEIERRSRGSHATLLHCRVDPRNSELILESVGDSLVVLVNAKGWCEETWPYKSLDEFPQVPSSLSSRPPYVTGPVRRETLLLPHQGHILVMTDALGRFCRAFLDEHGGRLGLLDMLPFMWSGIISTDNPKFTEAELNENFREWVVEAKRSGSLEDDDITLVIAEYWIRRPSDGSDEGS